jgi:hypothetical protein
MEISPLDLQDLRDAKSRLENVGLAAKISSAVGTPIEKGFALLPKQWNATVLAVARKSLETAFDVALWSLKHGEPREPSNWWHKLAVGTTGAASGALGLAALAFELPVSTTIMLRSIADVARSEGEDLKSAESKIQCIQVLALGGKTAKDDAAESGYFAARAGLAKAVSDAVRHVAEKGISKSGGPAIVRLIGMIAPRFSISVSQKAAAQLIPVVGAIGGAVVNTLFIDHFQQMAKGHFVVRRLERAYGAEAIQKLYETL